MDKVLVTINPSTMDSQLNENVVSREKIIANHDVAYPPQSSFSATVAVTVPLSAIVVAQRSFAPRLKPGKSVQLMSTSTPRFITPHATTIRTAHPKCEVAIQVKVVSRAFNYVNATQHPEYLRSMSANVNQILPVSWRSVPTAVLER